MSEIFKQTDEKKAGEKKYTNQLSSRLLFWKDRPENLKSSSRVLVGDDLALPGPVPEKYWTSYRAI